MLRTCRLYINLQPILGISNPYDIQNWLLKKSSIQLQNQSFNCLCHPTTNTIHVKRWKVILPSTTLYQTLDIVKPNEHKFQPLPHLNKQHHHAPYAMPNEIAIPTFATPWDCKWHCKPKKNINLAIWILFQATKKLHALSYGCWIK